MASIAGLICLHFIAAALQSMIWVGGIESGLTIGLDRPRLVKFSSIVGVNHLEFDWIPMDQSPALDTPRALGNMALLSHPAPVVMRSEAFSPQLGRLAEVHP